MPVANNKTRGHLMKTISTLLLAFSLLFSGVALSATNIKFDGEVYSNKFTNNSPPIKSRRIC